MLSTHASATAYAVRFLVSAVVIAAVIAADGCGPKAIGPAGSVRVSGALTCGGEPVPMGTIIFQPVKGGSVTARIEDGGAFNTMLVPGDYSVVVNAMDGGDTMDEKGRPVPARRLVPQKYSSGATSDIKVTVTPKGDPLTIALSKWRALTPRRPCPYRRCYASIASTTSPIAAACLTASAACGSSRNSSRQAW